jgi:hypothetical protein
MNIMNYSQSSFVSLCYFVRKVHERGSKVGF